MAKIIEITNPLTGQPQKVIQSDFTAQQIDDAVATVLGGGGGVEIVNSFNGRTGKVMPQPGDYTAADVGAAPGGYGLGEQVGKLITDDLNNANQNGWYTCSVADGTNAPEAGGTKFGYGIMHVTRNAIFLRQDYFPAVGTVTPHCVRIQSDGVWGPWEWVNPPMLLGVEYRTTERWDDKPVYCIVWPGGDFPNSTTKSIEVDTGTPGAVTAIYSHAVLSTGTMVNGLYGSSVFEEGNYLGMFVQNNSTTGKFTVSLGSKRTVNANCTIFIKYTRG